MQTPTVELVYLPIAEQGFDPDLPDALKILDEEELIRFHRYKNDHARDCFIQARRIAKSLLAARLGCDAHQVKFQYSDNGKPSLIGAELPCFNISHSNSAVVVAVADVGVGVDTEEVDRRSKPWRATADYLNAHAEACVEACATEFESAATFATHWSCMESYVKLRGSSLFFDKDHVAIEPFAAFELGECFRYQEIYFKTFDLSDAMRISIATEGCLPLVSLKRWQGSAPLVDVGIY
ncbi:MAG: hypothetical protein COA42_23325 [Alteromonadaceae bacterium]|nr:MAG: hypothetical protein COA42_23325 [Alteromonadaceae bacterium]